jgi:hypothetical protein
MDPKRGRSDLFEIASVYIVSATGLAGRLISRFIPGTMHHGVGHAYPAIWAA